MFDSGHRCLERWSTRQRLYGLYDGAHARRRSVAGRRRTPPPLHSAAAQNRFGSKIFLLSARVRRYCPPAFLVRVPGLGCYTVGRKPERTLTNIIYLGINKYNYFFYVQVRAHNSPDDRAEFFENKHNCYVRTVW